MAQPSKIIRNIKVKKYYKSFSAKARKINNSCTRISPKVNDADI